MILTVQRRMMTLGKVRMGEKGPKGEPRKRDTFRFTSASRALIDALAEKYGGTPRAWEGAPDEGMFEVATDANEIDIILPPVFADADGAPTVPFSQFYELWSAGGCVRRCDGITDGLSGKPCLCNPDALECKITTRISFMIPDIPGLGVWGLESHGYNAAVELPGTIDVLLMAASARQFIPAVLRIEHRTKKTPGEPTKRFIVPVIDLPNVKIGELLSGSTPPVAVNAPVQEKLGRPALEAGGAVLPEEPAFEVEPSAGWGEPPKPATFDGTAALALTGRLLELADRLGKLDVTSLAVEKKRREVDDAGLIAWLTDQIAKAEAKLETVAS